LENPATCALRCNQCAAGWAGTITLNETLDTNNTPNVTAHHTETDVFYVGGTVTGSSQTLVLADWTATGGGSKTPVPPATGVSSTWTVNAVQAGSCAAAPGACLLVKPVPNGLLSFSLENQPFTVPGGIQYAQGTSPPQPYGAFQNQFDPISSTSPGQTVVSQQVLGHTVQVCSAPAFPSPYTCTQQWSWYLTLQ
jgi:hypothetical protein